MQNGKHVLTEKLMGHSVPICKEMGRVAKQQDKLLATGHQRHYSILVRQRGRCIRQGLIGDIHHIRAQWHRKADTWSPPVPGIPKAIRTWPKRSTIPKKKLDGDQARSNCELQKLLAQVR